MRDGPVGPQLLVSTPPTQEIKASCPRGSAPSSEQIQHIQMCSPGAGAARGACPQALQYPTLLWGLQTTSDYGRVWARMGPGRGRRSGWCHHPGWVTLGLASAHLSLRPLPASNYQLPKEGQEDRKQGRDDRHHRFSSPQSWEVCLQLQKGPHSPSHHNGATRH